MSWCPVFVVLRKNTFSRIVDSRITVSDGYKYSLSWKLANHDVQGISENWDTAKLSVYYPVDLIVIVFQISVHLIRGSILFSVLLCLAVYFANSQGNKNTKAVAHGRRSCLSTLPWCNVFSGKGQHFLKTFSIWSF